MNKYVFSMFNLPNLITTGNMLCGIISIILSLSGRIDLAPYPIFLGAFLDFFDGFFARLLKIEGELGKQLDSFADMITFGLAPGVMMMVILLMRGQLFQSKNDFLFVPEFSYFDGDGNLNYLAFFALIIPVFSMFRLAKFNLDTRQTTSFIGLPTPANTIFFCMFPFVFSANYSQSDSLMQENIRMILFHPMVLIPIILVMSILLVAELPLFSLKFKHFKWKGNEIRFLFLITCSLLIPLTLYWSLGIIVILYLILSLIENLFIKQKHEV